MSALPPALAGWSDELAELPEDVVAGLEPWLVRLSAALGPLARHPKSGRGAPDGFDGLTHRGSYERLLATEWLLAEQHPLEFLRRAANAEHLFYALKEQSTSDQRRLVALFDAGPEQLGAPRIAHLAFLLTLASRARAAKVELHWGTLQSEGGPTFTDVGAQSVLHLIRGRSRDNPSPAMLEDRLAALPAPKLSDEEVWLVGGPRTEAIAAARWCRARVTEPLSLGDRTLQIDLFRPRGAPHSIGPLPVPEGPVAVRLLRNPFEVREGGQRGQVPVSELFAPRFMVDGRAVMARTASGVLLQRLPSGRGEIPQPRHLSARETTPLALGRQAKRYELLVADDAGLSVLNYSNRGRFGYARKLASKRGADLASAPGPGRPLSPLLPLGGNRGEWLVTVDALGRGLLVPRTGDRSAELLCDGVKDIARIGGRTVLVLESEDDSSAPIALRGAGGRPLRQRDLPRRAIVWLDENGHVGRVVTLPQGDGDYRTAFSATSVAVRFEPDQWFVAHGRTDGIIDVGERRVLGPAGPRGAHVLALIVYDPGTGRLESLDPSGGAKDFGRLSVPPRAPVLAPSGSVVAFLTPKGALRGETLLGDLVFETHPEGK